MPELLTKQKLLAMVAELPGEELPAFEVAGLVERIACWLDAKELKQYEHQCKRTGLPLALVFRRLAMLAEAIPPERKQALMRREN